MQLETPDCYYRKCQTGEGILSMQVQLQFSNLQFAFRLLMKYINENNLARHFFSRAGGSSFTIVINVTACREEPKNSYANLY